VAPPDSREEKLDGPQRRRLLDPKLSVVVGLDGLVGQHGPADAQLREMGKDAAVNFQGQVLPGVRRSDGPGVSDRDREGEMGGQDLPGERVLLPRLLEGNSGNVPEHQREIQGDGGGGAQVKEAARGEGERELRRD